MSRIMSSSATSADALTIASADASNRLAQTTSTGIGTAAPRACIRASSDRALSTSPASASDLPIGNPAASMKVLAIPPPTIS